MTMHEEHATDQRALERTRAPLELRPRSRPIWLVSLLTFVTGGFYLFFWAGATWSELKRELKDEDMQPWPSPKASARSTPIGESPQQPGCGSWSGLCSGAAV